MLKFDKLKIVSTLDSVISNSPEIYQQIKKNGKLIKETFCSTSPSLLYVEMNIVQNEIIVEFTGKLLCDSYPSLINQCNIIECLQRVQEIGDLMIEIDTFVDNAQIVKADVCLDVSYPDCKALTQSLYTHISNHKKYLARKMGDNLVIEKNVKSKGRKRRLTVYDKGREMKLATNRDFLESVNERNILNYFSDKVRFELNLNSKEQIRQALKISDTSIHSVMASETSPIWEFLDIVIGDDEGRVENCSTLAELKNQLILDYCDGDLAKVEALLREYCSPKTHISQMMKPYIALSAKQFSGDIPPNIKQRLRELLMEIAILLGLVSI